MTKLTASHEKKFTQPLYKLAVSYDRPIVREGVSKNAVKTLPSKKRLFNPDFRLMDELLRPIPIKDQLYYPHPKCDRHYQAILAQK